SISHPTNTRSSYSQETDFVENPIIIATPLSKTSPPELQWKWPHRRILSRIFYVQFSEAAPEQMESINFPDENEACQTPTLKPTNAENLVRGCNQCLPKSLIFLFNRRNCYNLLFSIG
ncbi:unnamed protein product, partial [Hymenolepis diminuta]